MADKKEDSGNASVADNSENSSSKAGEKSSTTSTKSKSSTSEVIAMPSSEQSKAPVPVAIDNYEEYVLEPKTAWPPPVFIKKSAPVQERFYLENRWHSQWHWYDQKASEYKEKHFFYQRIVVIGSLIIPALISLNSAIARFLATTLGTIITSDETIWRIGIDSITVLISLSVAGAAALESLYKYGENWSSYRSAAEELQAEKNYYDMGAGAYADTTTAFATFVDRVEGIIANQNGKYFQSVQQNIQKIAEDNRELYDQFVSDNDDETNGQATSLG